MREIKHDRGLRCRGKYSLPKIRTEIGRGNISYQGIYLWNKLDVGLREERKKKRFREGIKRELERGII